MRKNSSNFQRARYGILKNDLAALLPHALRKFRHLCYRAFAITGTTSHLRFYGFKTGCQDSEKVGIPKHSNSLCLKALAVRKVGKSEFHLGPSRCGKAEVVPSYV